MITGAEKANIVRLFDAALSRIQPARESMSMKVDRLGVTVHLSRRGWDGEQHNAERRFSMEHLNQALPVVTYSYIDEALNVLRRHAGKD
jgi:hypothetical protein